MMRDWHEVEGVGARLIARRLRLMEPPVLIHPATVQRYLDFTRRPYIPSGAQAAERAP